MLGDFPLSLLLIVQMVLYKHRAMIPVYMQMSYHPEAFGYRVYDLKTENGFLVGWVVISHGTVDIPIAVSVLGERRYGNVFRSDDIFPRLRTWLKDWCMELRWREKEERDNDNQE